MLARKMKRNCPMANRREMLRVIAANGEILLQRPSKIFQQARPIDFVLEISSCHAEAAVGKNERESSSEMLLLWRRRAKADKYA